MKNYYGVGPTCLSEDCERYDLSLPTSKEKKKAHSI